MSAERLLQKKPFKLDGFDKLFGWQTVINAMEEYAKEANQPKDGLREAAEKVVIIYNNGYRHALRRPMEELEKALK